MKIFCRKNSLLALTFALSLTSTSQLASAASEIGLKNFAQIYQNLITSFGFEKVPAELKDTFLILKTRLPQSGRVEDMNSAVPAAQLSLTHKACQFFVREEALKPAAQRRAFGPVDFDAAVTSITPELLQSVTTNVGTLLLTEPLTASQQTNMIHSLQKLIPLLKNSPKSSVLFMTEVCAAIGSSLGALVI